MHLYSIGTDILLSPDVLRTSLENNPNTKTNTDIFYTLFNSSAALNPEARSAIIDLLPRLYRTYIDALRKHGSLLFSSTPPGQQVRERLRIAATHFGGVSLAFLKDVEAEMEALRVWRARIGVLHVMEEEAMFDYIKGTEAAKRIRQVGEAALKLLDRASDGAFTFLISLACEAF